MNTEDDLHLDEKRLLCAIVDESDLSLPERDHLLNCLGCRAQKERIEESLGQMGRVAERSVPRPLGKVVAPFERARESNWRRLWLPDWKWTLAAGFTAALVVAVGLGSVFFTVRRDNARTALLYKEMQDDERLITEVGKLEEKSSLPHVYIDISEGAEREGDDSFNESTARLPERYTQMDLSYPRRMEKKPC